MKTPFITGLLLLPLGCGGDPTGSGSAALEPSELCSDHGNSAIATFEDPNMERAVRDWSGVGAQDDLTCGLVSGIDGIDMHDYGITSLVGIQNLTSLNGLELSNNLITDISALSGLTGLTTLSLADNSITDLTALSGLTSLMRLELHNNSITDISALSGLTNLTDLRLPNNSITDTSGLSGLTSLIDLWLNINSITDISALSGLTHLNSLLLSNNPNLSNIQPLLDNTGLGTPTSFGGRFVDLRFTSVSCTDVAALKAKGFVAVDSDCP
jgi:hypothetical protein